MAAHAHRSSPPGQALLRTAVDAIQDGRWDDLTRALQSNAAALQAARLRLEEKALRKHATGRAARAQAEADVGGTSPPDDPKTPANGLETEGAVSPHAAEWRGVSGMAVHAVAACWSWADRNPLLAVLVVQIAVVLAYAPALAYEGYKMDDAVAIERNPNVVADEVPFSEMMRRDFWGLPMHGSGWTNKSFRPLTTLSFRLGYLLHGLQSSGFFVANVLMHCVASIVVGVSGVSFVGLPGSCAALSSLLFGVHPVHTENVLYLVGRADVLAAIFGILALVVYAALYCPPPPIASLGQGLRTPAGWANSSIWMAAPVALVVASGLCKESGFTLFALFLLMELLDLIDACTAAKRTGQRLPAKQWRSRRLRISLLVGSTFLVLVMRYRHTGGTSLNMSPQDNPISFEPSQLVRMLSYAYLHGVYMKLLFWPQFLCYDYSMDAIPAVHTIFDIRLMLPLTVYVFAFASVTAAFRARPRYRRASLLSLALLVVTFLPASNILFPVGTVIGERLLYVPSAGFCLAALVWLHRAISPPETVGLAKQSPRVRESASPNGHHNGGKKTGRGSAPREKRGAIEHCPKDKPAPLPLIVLRKLFAASSVGGVIVSALVLRTLVRVKDWETADSLYINDGAIQPTSSKVQFNLGITYMQMQEWDLAVEALLRCAWADPLSSLPFYRIGQIEILRGRFETAEEYLAAALEKFGASLMVRDEEVFHDLAIAMFQNGKHEAAETRLRVALQINPDFAKGWNNLACAMISRSLQDATRALRKAVSLAPENPQYWANLALLSQHTGDPSTASGAWRRAQELWPGIPEPRDCTWEFAPGS